MANRVTELLRTAPGPLSAASLLGGVLLIVTGHPAAAIAGGALILFAMLVPFLRLPPVGTASGRKPEHAEERGASGSPGAPPSPEVAPRTRASSGPVLLDVDFGGEDGLRWRGTSEQLAQLLVPPPPRGRGKPDATLAQEWGAEEALIRQVRASLLASIGEEPRPRGRRLPQS